MTDFELAIIGGGINGAGIARDAAGRGIRVLLVEQNDLASGTSSASTKLIHGGLRYVEQGHFRLVREALTERETLLKIAPHIIWPLRIILPHEESMRPAWVLRLGLFIYDHLGGRKILPPTQVRNLTHGMYGDPLKRRHRVGFEFSDCWVDDSRLVVLNAMDAAARGATIRTRTQCVRADREDGTWRLVLKSRSGAREIVTARALVNAAGPWAPITAETVLRIKPAGSVRLVKGSHIVLPRLFDHDRAYLLQMPDRRVVFAIPYERNFTLVGTTDQDFVGDLASVAANADEILYLCRAVNEYFRTAVTPTDIVHAFAGVRPLYGDDTRRPSELSRDYVLHLDRPPGRAPLLTVYGGKITTYRKLAEAALARLGHFFAARAPWTSRAPLPGGDFPVDGVERLVADARERWAYLTEANARRLVRAYGTRLDRIFEGAQSFDAAGPWFGFELSAAEVRYLLCHEWAETADDILWRRTKLGLRMPPAHRAALEAFLATARLRDAVT